MVMEPLYVLGELYVVARELPVPLEGEPPGRLQLMVYGPPAPPEGNACQVKVVRGGVVRPLTGETEHEPVTGAHTVMGCHALQLLPYRPGCSVTMFCQAVLLFAHQRYVYEPAVAGSV